ncbi:MAG TPA: hypothetical protein VHF25_04890 [Nitriliruptorales bacterium]|nr:hypothetical protein [Nitriliruptorales bacterium]
MRIRRLVVAGLLATGMLAALTGPASADKPCQLLDVNLRGNKACLVPGHHH